MADAAPLTRKASSEHLEGPAAARFEAVLQSAMAVLLTAGTATMQARSLLLTATAQPLGEEAVLRANAGLSTAFSLGSLLELLVGPNLQKLSDRVGRKRVFMALLTGPALVRTLCILIKEPWMRIRMLQLDFASVGIVGVSPMMALATTMVSDAFPDHLQANAHSRLRAAHALGMVIGNYASGWWNARAGPESTYAITAMVPILCMGYLGMLLPETNRSVRRGRKVQELQDQDPGVPAASSGSSSSGANGVAAPDMAADAERAAVEKRGAFRTVFSDLRCSLLVTIMGLYEFMNYGALNTVSILFMKERLSWGPLQCGRFASALALAGFTGSLAVARIRKALGEKREQLYVSLAHCLNGFGYLLWGSAGSAAGMAIPLPSLALGAGASPIMLARYVARAKALGLAKGEATAVYQAIAAGARMIAPQIFMFLWVRAVSKGKGARLPMGAPMLAIAVVALLQEALHQTWKRLEGPAL